MPQRLLPLVFLLILLCGFSYKVEAQGTCEPCKDAASLIDKESGICLPSAIDGFETALFTDTQRAALKSYRNSLATGYSAPQYRVAITMYLYDRTATDEAADSNEVRDAISQVLASHKGARLEAGGKSSLAVSGKPTDSHGALFSWTDRSIDYASFLWIIPLGNRFMKIRATYVRPLGSEAEAMKSAMESVKKVAASVCLAQ